MGFDHTDIYTRLRSAWVGEVGRLKTFWQAQDCATRFRALCRERNLLDLSLTTELFDRYLLSEPGFQRYLTARYRHLLADNLEENVPVAHRLVSWLLPRCDSAVLLIDEQGGHRVFLGADAAGADEIASQCRERIELSELAAVPRARAFAAAVGRALRVGPARPQAGDPQEAVRCCPTPSTGWAWCAWLLRASPSSCRRHARASHRRGGALRL